MTDDGLPDNALFRWYRRYIGEPEAETDVYLGFGLFFAGISFAAIALVLFLIGTMTHGFRESGYFAFAQPAYLLGMLALPIALVSIVVLLPTQRRVEYIAAGGIAITLLAGAGFLYVYPADWWEFGMQETLMVVATYAVGLTLVIAANGAALVAHQLEQVRAPTPSEITGDEAIERETVSEEQVRADIEDAMQDVELSWGGIMKDKHRRLELSADYADDYAGDIDVEATTTMSEGSVDDQVAQLQALKGGQQQTAESPSTVDDQTAALRELKQQKERDEVPANAPLARGGFFGRLLDRLGLN